MKKLLAAILALTIISQSLVYVAIGVYFHLNKQYISQQLCENRSNPQLHCNGHCYLSKQLKKAEQGESKSAQIIKEQDEIISDQCDKVLVVYFPAYQSHDTMIFNSTLYISDCSDSLIKPPSA